MAFGIEFVRRFLPWAAEAPPAEPEPLDPLQRAVRLCLDERWDEARDGLQALATPGCRCGRTWAALGTAYGRTGDWRRAQQALERARQLTPSTPVRQALEEVRAVRRWTRAVEHRPHDGEAHGSLGSLLLAWEHGDAGLDHLRRAVALRPDLAVVHLFLGHELWHRGDEPAARAAYEEAERLGHPLAAEALRALREGRPPYSDGAEEADHFWQDAIGA